MDFKNYILGEPNNQNSYCKYQLCVYQVEKCSEQTADIALQVSIEELNIQIPYVYSALTIF